MPPAPPSKETASAATRGSKQPIGVAGCATYADEAALVAANEASCPSQQLIYARAAALRAQAFAVPPLPELTPPRVLPGSVSPPTSEPPTMLDNTCSAVLREVVHQELQNFWDSTMQPAIADLRTLMLDGSGWPCLSSAGLHTPEMRKVSRPRSATSGNSAASQEDQMVLDPLSAPVELRRAGFNRRPFWKSVQVPSSPAEAACGSHANAEPGAESSSDPERPSHTAGQRRTRRLARIGVDQRTQRQALGDACLFAFDLVVGRTSLADFVTSPAFDQISGVLILANTITIGIQTEYMAQNLSEHIPLWLEALDKLLAVCFLIELMVRIRVFRGSFFCNSDGRPQAWNLFDFTLVLLQVVEEMMRIMIRTVSTSTDAGSMKPMRVMRILRLMRALRVMRMMRLLGDLRTIVSSVVGSLKSLGWTVLLLLMLMFVVGVYFTQVVTDTRLQDQSQLDEELVIHFHSLPQSVLALYFVVSGGVDWGSLCMAFMEGIGPHAGLMFVFYVAFVVLCIMNVVTGVFVDSALRNALHEDTEFTLDNLVKVFTNGDEDDDGVLSLAEFQEIIKDPQMKVYLESIDVDMHEATILFTLLDVDGIGEVNMLEFVNGCIKLRGQAKAIDLITVLWENRRMARVFAAHRIEQERYIVAVSVALEKVHSALVGLAASGVAEALRRSTAVSPPSPCTSPNKHVPDVSLPLCGDSACVSGLTVSAHVPELFLPLPAPGPFQPFSAWNAPLIPTPRGLPAVENYRGDL